MKRITNFVYSIWTTWRRGELGFWSVNFTSRRLVTSSAKPTNKGWPRNRATSGSCQIGNNFHQPFLNRNYSKKLERFSNKSSLQYEKIRSSFLFNRLNKLFVKLASGTHTTGTTLTPSWASRTRSRAPPCPCPTCRTAPRLKWLR